MLLDNVFDAVENGDLLTLALGVQKYGPNAIGEDGFGREGVPLLMHAINSDEPEHVKFLLEQGADPNLMDGNMSTPLMRYIMLARWNDGQDDYHIEQVKLLLQHGADPYRIGSYDEKSDLLLAVDSIDAIGCCITSGAENLFNFFLEEGYDVDRSYSDGSNSAYLAACHSAVIYNKLTNMGLELSTPSDLTSILFSKNLQAESVNSIKISKEVANLTDHLGQTAIFKHIQARHVDIDLLVTMIFKGIDLNHADLLGYTVLDYAQALGHTDAVEVLKKSEAVSGNNSRNSLQLSELAEYMNGSKSIHDVPASERHHLCVDLFNICTKAAKETHSVVDIKKCWYFLMNQELVTLEDVDTLKELFDTLGEEHVEDILQMLLEGSQKTETTFMSFTNVFVKSLNGSMHIRNLLALRKPGAGQKTFTLEDPLDIVLA